MGVDSIKRIRRRSPAMTLDTQMIVGSPADEIRRRMREAFRYFRKQGVRAYYSYP